LVPLLVLSQLKHFGAILPLRESRLLTILGLILAAPSQGVITDRLDAFGRWVLGFADPRYIGLLVLFSVSLCSVIRKQRRGKWPTAIHFGRGIVAAVFIVSGFVVFVIFMLTRPPAVELLSGESHTLVGLFTLIFTVGIGYREIRRLFLDKVADPHEDD
jgi:hypothetical protein